MDNNDPLTHFSKNITSTSYFFIFSDWQLETIMSYLPCLFWFFFYSVTDNRRNIETFSLFRKNYNFYKCMLSFSLNDKWSRNYLQTHENCWIISHFSKTYFYKCFCIHWLVGKNESSSVFPLFSSYKYGEHGIIFLFVQIYLLHYVAI